MKITLIGHSTVLIEAAGKRLLTDPFFHLHGNPAYARVRPPARSREELSQVDLVLVSHNHFDHIDGPYLRGLPKTTPVAAPAASAWMTRLKGGRNVTGLHAWQQTRLADISITAVPATHVTFTSGYVIDLEGKRIYFAGDTYFSGFMNRIAQDLHPQIALMPVTTFRVPMTMGENGALKATRALSPGTVIPIHLGIRPRLGLLRTSQTPERFRDKVQAAGLLTKVVILREGDSWET